MTETIFDIESVNDDLGRFEPENDLIKIFLATMYSEFKKYHGVTEEFLYWMIIDVLIHENIHASIDQCLEGKPEDVDDHKVFKYLSPI